MKKVALITILVLSINLSGQEKEFLNKVEDPDFKEFINLFYAIDFPINSIGIIDRIDPLRFKDMPYDLSKKILKLEDKDFIDTCLYDPPLEESDLPPDTNKYYTAKDMYLALAKYYLNDNYIVFIYTDSKRCGSMKRHFIVIMNYKGEVITKKVIRRTVNFDSQEIYNNPKSLEDMTLYTVESFVLVNKNSYVSFKYEPNEDNVKEKIEDAIDVTFIYKNDTLPKTKCIITEYKITQEGKINKKRSSSILLKNNHYKYVMNGCENIEDNPANKYFIKKK